MQREFSYVQLSVSIENLLCSFNWVVGKWQYAQNNFGYKHGFCVDILERRHVRNFFEPFFTGIRQGKIYRSYQRLHPQCEHPHPAQMSPGCLQLYTMLCCWYHAPQITIPTLILCAHMLSTRICGCTLQISHCRKVWYSRNDLWFLWDTLLFLHNSSTEVIWVWFASQAGVQTLHEMFCFQDEVGKDPYGLAKPEGQVWHICSRLDMLQE